MIVCVQRNETGRAFGPDLSRIIGSLSVANPGCDLRSTAREQPFSEGHVMTWKYLRTYLATHKITYRQYLESDHWKQLRSRFWASKLHKRRCVVCGACAPLEVHHRSYRRIGQERLNDLMLLCRNCHKATHELDRTRTNGCLWGAAKRLRKDRVSAGLPVG